MYKKILSNYYVNEKGSVFSKKSKRFLKPRRDDKGYLTFNLCEQGICKTYKAHRLVADAFLKNPQEKPQVNHLDGNKENNNFLNLKWATAKENIRHAHRNGLVASQKGKKKKRKLINKSFYGRRPINAKHYWYDKERKKYRVRVKHWGVFHNVGSFSTKSEAVQARDRFLAAIN